MGLSLLPVTAQEEEGSKGRELRLLAWAPAEIPLSLGSGKRAVAVALSTDQFTLIKGKQLPGGKTVEVFAEVPDLKGEPRRQNSQPDKPGQPSDPNEIPLYQPGLPPPSNPDEPPPLEEPLLLAGPTKKILYASATWPAGSRHVIGFLVPLGNGTIPKGKLMLLPDSPSLHPEHSMRAINLTEVPLGIRLGEKKVLLPVRGDLISPFEPGRLRIEISVEENETWKAITGSYLATARHYRCFVLIRPQVNPNPLFPSDEPDIQNILEQTSPLPKRAPLPTPPPAVAAEPSATDDAPSVLEPYPASPPPPPN
jgi:hypothetical protein